MPEAGELTDMTRVQTIMNLALQITANLAIAFEPFLPFSAEDAGGRLVVIGPTGPVKPGCQVG